MDREQEKAVVRDWMIAEGIAIKDDLPYPSARSLKLISEKAPRAEVMQSLKSDFWTQESLGD